MKYGREYNLKTPLGARKKANKKGGLTSSEFSQVELKIIENNFKRL